MAKVLVTGGGGFLGKALVAQLLARGDEVTSITRRPQPQLEKLGVRCIYGDLTQKDVVFSAAQGMEVIYHTASKAGIWGSYADYEPINIWAVRHLLEACRRLGVGAFIYTSTPSVIYRPATDFAYVDETTPYPSFYDCAYAQTKALAEQEVLAANSPQVRTVALRPHLIYGPDDPHLVPRVVERAYAGQLFQVGEGRNLVDLTYVDNAAQAHIAAYTHLERCAGQAYFIGDGAAVNLWGWIKELLAQVGAPPIKIKVSYRLTRALGALLEGIYRSLRIAEEPKMTRFVADQLALSNYFNKAKAERDLEFKPQVSAQEGVRRLREWILGEGGANLRHRSITVL